MPTVSNKQSHHSSYNFYKLLHLQRAPMHILNFVCFLSAAGCIVWMTKQKCEQNLSQMATCKIRHLVTQRKVEIAIRWWPANWPCKAVNRQRCSSNQPLTFRPLWWIEQHFHLHFTTNQELHDSQYIFFTENEPNRFSRYLLKFTLHIHLKVTAKKLDMKIFLNFGLRKSCLMIYGCIAN